MSARWLARAAFVLVLAMAADLVGFAQRASLAMVAVGAAGACLMAAGGAAGAPPRPGGVYGPAATISAATIVTFGSEIDFRFSQDAGDEASVAESARTAIMRASKVRLKADTTGTTDTRSCFPQ